MDKKNIFFLQTLGRLIKKQRIKIGKSETYVADYLGENIQMVKAIERGEVEISLSILAKLTQLFNIDLMAETNKKIELQTQKKQQTSISFSGVLGGLINIKRKELGLSQDELALKMHLTRITLSKIENGDTNISVQKLILLDNIFNSDLMKETKEKIKILKRENVEVLYSDQEIKNKKKDKTAKYIAGATAIAVLFALLK